MKSLLGFFLLLAFTTLPHNLSASHYTSGEIYYKYIGDSTGVANQYQIFLKLYGKYLSTNNRLGTFQIIYISSSCGSDTGIYANRMVPPAGQAHPMDNLAWRLPDFDLCVNTSSARSSMVHKFSTTAILPPCADYKIKLSALCCRDALDNLVAVSNLFLEANLNNTQGQNSSPQIISPAGRTFCLSQPGQAEAFYPHTVIEEDGDSLVYSLATPQSSDLNGSNLSCGPGIDIAYSGNFTANSPLPSSTGTSLNPNDGLLSFSPSLTGNYLVKIDVNEYRFDTISLQWLNIGNTTRDFTVYVVSSCSPQITAGPKLKNSPSPGSLQSLFTSEIDSMKLAYGVPQIKGSDSTTTGPLTLIKLPFNHGYSCFDTILDLTFNNRINYQSLDPTDIRLIGPDGVPRPIVGIKDLNTISSSDRVQLILHQPLDTDGNYLVQFKTGLDGNTLINECGYAMEEFYSAIVVVDSCPQASYDLASVSVNNNEFVRLQWTASNGLNDPLLLQNFDAWIIHRRNPNSNQMAPLKVINDPSVRIFTDSLPFTGYAISNAIYDYALLLKYNGKRREMTRTCSNIKVSAAPSGPGLKNIFLSWNHYNCLDPNSRVYKIYRGAIDSTNNSVSWQQQGDMTSVNNFTVNHSSTNSSAAGTFAYKVVAQKQRNNTAQDFSESNWVYFYHNPNLSISRKMGKGLRIPNLITPNADGINDRFYIETSPEGPALNQISLSIYQRNGELLYENNHFENSNSNDSGWEGVNSSGQALPNGVYYYIIEVESSTKDKEHFQGSITLNRTF